MRRKKRALKGTATQTPIPQPVSGDLLQQGIDHHQQGQFQEAEKIYRQILQSDPGHGDANHLLGVIAHQVGKNEIAEELILKAIQRDPAQALYHLNLGNVLQNLNRSTDAIASYRKALAITPDFAEAHNNMGNALKTGGHPESAISCFQKALAIRPDYVEALNNFGNSLKEFEQYEGAIAQLQKAVRLNPAYADAHANLAQAFFANGQTREAIENCRQAIALKPDFIDAHINLGVILHKQGDLEDCLQTCRQAVALAADNPATHAALANVLRDLDCDEEALACYQQVIALNPGDEEAWGNLQQTTKTLLFSKGEHSADGRAPAVPTGYHLPLFEHYLDGFRPHRSGASFDAALASLPARTTLNVGTGASPTLFDQTVALFHFGRSGTGLLHSLLDNHPEISTLPSIYLSGYFNAGVWQELAAGDPDKLAERFADKFAVLFDASSPVAVPGTQKDGLANAGVKEGMTTLGVNRNETLKVDRDLFCSHARRLMATLGEIDAGVFLQIVHAAYEHAHGREADRKTIFYHIHNPGMFAKLNFLRHTPDARLLMMIRDPLQSCESWMKRVFDNNEYNSMVQRIITMAYDIDQPAFSRQDSIGVRLEDLKSNPKETMQGIGDWLGVRENASMYEMTAQGKKWWGDPSSPDYADNTEMSPFDDTCLRRPGGSIFGERDRLVLETLFYPFNVHFGYREAEPERFTANLKVARALLNEPLDFEQAYLDRTGRDPQRLQQNNYYRLLRAALTDRFDVLDELGTYPGMLTPLTLNRGAAI